MAFSEEGGFYGYQIQSIDLGPGLLLTAYLAFFFAYGFVLPCLVYLGNRYEALRQAEKAASLVEDSDEFFSKSLHECSQALVDTTSFPLAITRDSEKAATIPRRPHSTYTSVVLRKRVEDAKAIEGKLVLSSKGIAFYPSTCNATQSEKIKMAWTNLHEHKISKATSQHPILKLVHKKQGKTCYFQVKDREDLLAISADIKSRRNEALNPHNDLEGGSVTSGGSQKSSSTIGSTVADIVSHGRSRGQRRRRRARYQYMDEAKRTAGQSAHFHASRADPVVYSTLLQGNHPGGVSADEVVPLDPNNSSKKTTIPEVPSTAAPKTMKYAEDYTSLGMLDKMAILGAYDIETRRIIRLAAPFCTQAFITGLTNILLVAVIGKMIGTREVSAYVIVLLWVELSSEFVGGLHEALATLCSQAIGARNKPLAGSYVQIVVILFTVFFIPFCIFWIVYMGAILRWHEMDEETVRIGVLYTKILIVHKVVDGWEECIHGLLDVSGHEKWSTLVGGTQEVTALVITFIWALVGNPDLNTVGLIQLAMCVICTTFNIVVIHSKGWFKPYYKGMFGSFALTVSLFFLALLLGNLSSNRCLLWLTLFLLRMAKRFGWFARPDHRLLSVCC
jgi:MatE/TFIIH p62 subunit, N-terminal domain